MAVPVAVVVAIAVGVSLGVAVSCGACASTCCGVIVGQGVVATNGAAIPFAVEVSAGQSEVASKRTPQSSR